MAERSELLVSVATMSGILSSSPVLGLYVILALYLRHILKKKKSDKNLRKSDNKWDSAETVAVACGGFGDKHGGLSCQASASFSKEERRAGWEVAESAVVWVCGGKPALSSEWRFNNPGKKNDGEGICSLYFHWNWKYISFLLFFSFEGYPYFECTLETWNTPESSCSGPWRWGGWDNKEVGVVGKLEELWGESSPCQEGLIRLKRSLGILCPKRSSSYVPDMATLMFPVGDESWSWKTEHDSFPHQGAQRKQYNHGSWDHLLNFSEETEPQAFGIRLESQLSQK